MLKSDLQQIKDYIADELKNTRGAVNTIEKILKVCGGLKKYPMLGVVLEDKFDIETDYRCLIIGEYVAFYNIVDEIVWVRRIFSSRRDYIRDLFLE